MFPGASMVMGPRGDVRSRAPVWEEAMLSPRSTWAISREPASDVPLLADLRTALPHLRELLDAVDRDHVRPPVEWDPVPPSDHRVRNDHGAPTATWLRNSVATVVARRLG